MKAIDSSYFLPVHPSLSQFLFFFRLFQKKQKQRRKIPAVFFSYRK